MLIIKVSDVKQLEIVVELADTIWHEYFTPIIGKDQVDYKLKKFQSKESITQQIHDGVVYFLLMEDTVPIGYVGIIIKNSELFLSKFYILSAERNKGFGKQVIKFLEQLAIGYERHNISLTINKNNINTIKAYQKMGFINLGAIVQDIGDGFVMDDYKMEKNI